MNITVKTLNKDTNFEVVDNELMLFAHSESTNIMNQGALTFATNVAVVVPKGYIGLVLPVDSLFTKTSLIMPTAPQQIVSGEFISVYAKPLMVAGGKKFKIGDVIAKVLFLPIVPIEVTHAKEEGTVAT